MHGFRLQAAAQHKPLAQGRRRAAKGAVLIKPICSKHYQEQTNASRN
jgi:hypothetical protein